MAQRARALRPLRRAVLELRDRERALVRRTVGHALSELLAVLSRADELSAEAEDLVCLHPGIAGTVLLDLVRDLGAIRAANNKAHRLAIGSLGVVAGVANESRGES